MRKWICFLVLSACVFSGIAQTENDPPYKRFPTVPSFSLLAIDSTMITKDNLASNKPTILMYFNPGCEHCQHQMEDIIAHKEALKDLQIVMATYAPLNELAEFIAKYKVTEFPNIKAGRDTKYMLQPFFKIGGLPYQALYDTDGKLITTYEGNVKIDTLLSAFKKKD
ncbi:TlpA family protein disulfide reductase [Flavitalea sp.]|nr:redoxin domain-containing protein [Flavitalea sp.]